MIIELAACQVFVSSADFSTAEAFHGLLQRVGSKLDAARARAPDGSFSHPCLAVFPEMIGAFLPLVGRAERVKGATTTDQALTRVALRQLGSVFSAMIRGRTFSTKVGFLLSVSAEVRALYRSAFSEFARRHQCWVVAGSALLPENLHGDLEEHFEAKGGRVYNTSYSFAPDGRQVGCVRKVNLVPTLEDTLGLSPGRASELVPIETPMGKVGTLICYDGFNEAHTRTEPRFARLVEGYDLAGCEILAQPAANPWPWEDPWFFAEEGETLLRKEQWLKEGLFAQLQAGGLEKIRYAVNPQLLGQVFDNHFDGRSYLFGREGTEVRILAQSARADASLEAEEVLLRAVELKSAAGMSASQAPQQSPAPMQA